MKEKVEYRIASLLRNGGGTLSVAESCTGGEISHLITTVSGSSEYYLGSVTSYAVSVKRKLLGVPAATIEEHGVVSREVAAAMAEGVRAATGSDYSVATTGLAEGKRPCRNEDPALQLQSRPHRQHQTVRRSRARISRGLHRGKLTDHAKALDHADGFCPPDSDQPRQSCLGFARTNGCCRSCSEGGCPRNSRLTRGKLRQQPLKSHFWTRLSAPDKLTTIAHL